MVAGAASHPKQLSLITRAASRPDQLASLFVPRDPSDASSLEHRQKPEYPEAEELRSKQVRTSEGNMCGYFQTSRQRWQMRLDRWAILAHAKGNDGAKLGKALHRKFRRLF
jgi:hypothetical protein